MLWFYDEERRTGKATTSECKLNRSQCTLLDWWKLHRAVAAEDDNAAETATADRCLPSRLPALVHHHHRDGQPNRRGDALKSAAADHSGLLTQAADRSPKISIRVPVKRSSSQRSKNKTPPSAILRSTALLSDVSPSETSSNKTIVFMAWRFDRRYVGSLPFWSNIPHTLLCATFTARCTRWYSRCTDSVAYQELLQTWEQTASFALYFLTRSKRRGIHC